MDDRRFPGTLRFSDPVERNEARIRSARLLVQIAAHRREPIAAEVVTDAARLLPGEHRRGRPDSTGRGARRLRVLLSLRRRDRA